MIELSLKIPSLTVSLGKRLELISSIYILLKTDFTLSGDENFDLSFPIVQLHPMT